MNAKKAVIGLMTALSLSLAPVGYATAAGIQFGIADNLIVNGVDGAAPTPDVAIKGFTVFGATQAAPALEIPAAPGNIFINGYVQVSSGAYFVGNSTFAKSAYFTDGSTFTAAGKIFINDGSAGQLLQRSGSGNLIWISSAALGDNLGSHIATMTVDMKGWNMVNVSSVNFKSNVYLSSATAAQYSGLYVSTHAYFAADAGIYNVSSITATGALTVSSVTATGIGVNAAQVWLSTINVVISSASQAQYGGVYVSSHAYFATGAGIYNVSTITATGEFTTYSSMTVAGNAFSVGGSTLVVSYGNVGVGTAGPGAKLHVMSTPTASYSLIVSSGADTGSYHVAVTTTGRVGVGLAVPDARLHVQAYEDGKNTVYISTTATAGEYSIAVSSTGITNIKNLVIENRTSNPPNPVSGQIWLRTDLE